MQTKRIVTIVTVVVVLTLLLATSFTTAGPQSRLTADNPNPPASTVKLIFIHHSCGENWLDDGDGGLGLALRNNNYFVSDTNYEWGPGNIGDTTDIGHWWTWFRGPNSATYLSTLYAESGQNSSYSRLSTDPGSENEVIMFKSCFPNSHLGGSPGDPPTTGSNPLRGQDAWSEYMTVANAKGIYNDILEYFQTRQDKLFVVIAAPPLVANDTDASHAANARAFNNWLVNDWLDGYPYDNVAVFDFYNVLTSNGGNANTNDLGSATGNHHRWWSGAVQHIQTVSNNYSAYPVGDSHPTAAGNQKATGELIQLLNVFYHRWMGDGGTPTPTATGTPSTATPTPTATATGTLPPSTATPTPTPTPTATGTQPPSTATPTPTGTPPTGQQTMTFQNSVWPDASYAGTSDATITTWSGNSYANLGGWDYLQVGETGDADEFRFLVRFELDAWLPADIQVDEAWLEVRAYDSGYDDDPHDVAAHRVTEEWVEGDGWDLEADGRSEGVTWTTARPGVNWAAPGGDFDLAELDRVTVAANPDGWYRWDVTSAVRAWVDGTASNYGLLLEPDNAPWTHHEFRSSEYSTLNLRPRLVVTYTVGGAATGTPTSTPSPTSTPGEPPTRWIYLPLILKNWAAPTPTPTPTATTVTPSGLIQPTDLVYQGAFAYPPGDEWTYSGHALAYYPEGDPTGPADGYPGSLYAAGHAWYDLVGEITIPEPVTSDNFDDLPEASVLRALTDITGGWKDNCTYNDDCMYREVDGLEYLPNAAHGGNKIVWNLRDWYNVAGYDQDSLGWSELDMTGAQGVWHIGGRGNDVFHNAKTCNYLFKAPASFADENLDGKWLIAGSHREAGALGGSQGPTLYALAPWEDGNPPASGQNLDALALLYYPEIYDCVWEAEGDINEDPEPGLCHFPGYRAMDNWGGGAWVQTADRSGILIFGRKGLGDNCYGTQGECSGDPCVPSKGYHAYPYEPQILFYDPEELKEAIAGTREPWEVLPYEVYSPANEVLDQECAILGAAAYDQERGLIYVTEQEAGPWGETAVHVWEVQ